MSFMIETSVAIAMRDKDVAIISKIAQLDRLLIMSAVTRVELEGGVYRDPALSASRRVRLDAMLKSIAVVSFNDAEAQAYGAIVAHAGYSRRKLLDRMIAANALMHRATLVTLNAGDFADVPGLNVLDWG